MGRFFDRSELVLIVMIFVLFDLNGACREFINHICFKNKKQTIAFLIVLGVLVYDVVLINLVINSPKTPPVTFTVDDSNPSHAHNQEEQTPQVKCEFETNVQRTDLNKKISQLDSLCVDNSGSNALIISKKIVTIFIAVVLLMITFACLTISSDSYPNTEINPLSTRFFYSTPLIIAVIILIYLAYI